MYVYIMYDVYIHVVIHCIDVRIITHASIVVCFMHGVGYAHQVDPNGNLFEVWGGLRPPGRP